MIVYDVATKVLDTEIFPQHNITGLISGIQLLFCLVRRSLQSGRLNTHTNKQAHNHTHAYTHSQIQTSFKLHYDQ